ncbi:MAG: divergent polysaccharide deacetylase family protein, partial [Deltaproteobacteria bacterium]
MGKSRARQSRRGKWGAGAGYTLAFFLGAALAIGGSIYWMSERPPSPEAFSRNIFLIDQLIRSQFHEIGISKKEILLDHAISREEGKTARDRHSLKIQLPGTVPFSLVEGNFKKDLSLLGSPFSIRFHQKPESLQVEISIQDRVTHEILFLRPPQAMIPKTALRSKVAIVIDDLGGENRISQEILKRNLPVTLSILPFTPHSKTLATEAHRKGREVILHLPMEPHGYPKVRPGDGVLLYEMDRGALMDQLSKDIKAVPFISGASNHMGSRFMEDPEKLKMILSELKRRGLFFLDSRTTPETVGLQTAQSIGLSCAERTVFLDHVTDEETIRRSVERL